MWAIGWKIGWKGSNTCTCACPKCRGYMERQWCDECGGRGVVSYDVYGYPTFVRVSVDDYECSQGREMRR